MDTYSSPLPPCVLSTHYTQKARSVQPPPREAWRDIDTDVAGSHVGCGVVAFLLALVVALVVGGVIYAVLTDNRIGSIGLRPRFLRPRLPRLRFLRPCRASHRQRRTRAISPSRPCRRL